MKWCLALQGLPVMPSSWTLILILIKIKNTLWSTVLATAVHQPVRDPKEKCQRSTGFDAGEAAPLGVSKAEVNPFPRKCGHQDPENTELFRLEKLSKIKSNHQPSSTKATTNPCPTFTYVLNPFQDGDLIHRAPYARGKESEFYSPSNPNYSTFLWNKTPSCLPRVPINLHAIMHAAHKLTLHKFSAWKKENKPNKTCLGNSPLSWKKFINWKYVNNSLLHLILSPSHPFSILKESKQTPLDALHTLLGKQRQAFTQEIQTQSRSPFVAPLLWTHPDISQHTWT